MKTTLNIRTDIMQQILKAAQARGIFCSEMIVILMKMIMQDIGNTQYMGRLVQYQARRGPEEWHTFHITWKGNDYEYFLDLKKLLKMSVSLLLAEAVRRYLSKTNKIHKSDNNLFIHYAIIKEETSNTICWRFIWGRAPFPARCL